MSRYLGPAIFGLVWLVVDRFYGETGTLRLFGGCFLLFAIHGLWLPGMKIGLGRQWETSVGGWKKNVVLAMVAGIGIAVLVYAPEIACLDNRYRHLCQR
jgi:hypothetical protein